MKGKNQKIKLQVLICTLGEAGIKRVAAASHPSVEEVEYLVSWQLPERDVPIPEELSKRSDFRIVKNRTRGLSKNRNLALAAASAPICLIADDDLAYEADAFRKIIETFQDNPEIDIATFKYTGTDSKSYPSETFNLSKPPKGYFITSFEIAFRRDKIIESGIKFNEDFGIGGKFPAGEEDIWIHDMLRYGLRGKFFPTAIARHEGATTGIRLAADPELIRTKGAVFAHTHPWTWPLRMLAHAWRYQFKLGRFSMLLQYCNLWIKGVGQAIKYNRD